MNRSVSFTATGTLDSGEGILYSVNVCAGADAATVTLRTGGSGGTVICKVGAPTAGGSAERHFVDGIPYNNLHATITGTTPQCDVEV